RASSTSLAFSGRTMPITSFTARAFPSRRRAYRLRQRAVEPSGGASYTWTMHPDPQSDSVFTLYRRGIELLEEEDFAEAAESLEEAARRAPEKSSIREALGRAYFRSGRFAAAAV